MQHDRRDSNKDICAFLVQPRRFEQLTSWICALGRMLLHNWIVSLNFKALHFSRSYARGRPPSLIPEKRKKWKEDRSERQKENHRLMSHSFISTSRLRQLPGSRPLGRRRFFTLPNSYRPFAHIYCPFCTKLVVSIFFTTLMILRSHVPLLLTNRAGIVHASPADLTSVI